MPASTPRRVARAAAVLVALALPLAASGSAGAADSHAPIQGSGSSWSSNAVQQWIADVEPTGLQVVFTASGSAQGRKDFANNATDFAVSDIGFQGSDPSTGESDTAQGRGYAYLPIVAGGTSFPYQLRVNGKQVRELRLSSTTLSKIFTNQITNWNDAAITRDNNGRQLPSLPIIPVVHSEGSGSTAQFTRYLDRVTPDIWHNFYGRTGLTEYYPRKGNAIAQNGSDGVMNFISSAAANGAIGYDEYSYALGKDFPVVKLLNKAGYYTLPTQYNVAVGLTQAQINMDKSSPDYLLQNLDNVYVYGDARTYPMSSYSYAIIPIDANDAKMNTAKRQTLVDYLYYSVCSGQKEMGPIGYSPLPINLVQASFDQVNKLKQADNNVNVASRDVTTCHNPTFVAGQPKRNYLAEIAPQPAACDKDGSGPCGEGAITPGTQGTSAGKSRPSRGSRTSVPGAALPAAGTAVVPGRGTAPAGGGTLGRPSGTSGSGQAAALPGAAPAAVDPVTGQAATAASADAGTGGTPLVAVPTTVDGSPGGAGLGLAAAALLLAVLVVPAVLARRLDSTSGPRQ